MGTNRTICAATLWGLGIPQLGGAQCCSLWIVSLSPTAGGLFSSHGPLASTSLQIASVGSDHHGKTLRSQPVDEVQDHFTIHLSLLILRGVVGEQK